MLMFGALGKRKADPGKPSAERPGEAGAGSSSGPQDKRPWEGDASFVACNLAGSNLAHNLPGWLMHDGRVHAETYVAAAGAIAGFAAQCSFLEISTRGSSEIKVATTRAQNRYLFSDDLNAMLYANDAGQANGRVWKIGMGGAVAAGMPLADAPKLEDMFADVASAIGSPNDGFPGVDDRNRPQWPAPNLLRAIWPHVIELFKADFDETHKRSGRCPRNGGDPSPRI
jgi:hypothetical protein